MHVVLLPTLKTKLMQTLLLVKRHIYLDLATTVARWVILETTVRDLWMQIPLVDEHISKTQAKNDATYEQLCFYLFPFLLTKNFEKHYDCL